LFGFSWLYQKLIKPALKNFKGEPKPKNEPEPTTIAPINQNQPPIIIMPPQQQNPPANYYQPLPSQPPEAKVIVAEPPKLNASEEKATEISPILSRENHELPQLNATNENTRTTMSETPPQKPEPLIEKNSKLTEKDHEPTPTKKNNKKRKKTKNNHN
jgi:hypothetical protein